MKMKKRVRVSIYQCILVLEGEEVKEYVCFDRSKRGEPFCDITEDEKDDKCAYLCILVLEGGKIKEYACFRRSQLCEPSCTINEYEKEEEVNIYPCILVLTGGKIKECICFRWSKRSEPLCDINGDEEEGTCKYPSLFIQYLSCEKQSVTYISKNLYNVCGGESELSAPHPTPSTNTK